MSRFKKWLVGKYLPNWARHTLMEENERLNGEVQRLQTERDCLQSYCDGLETALRTIRRITINNEVR